MSTVILLCTLLIIFSTLVVAASSESSETLDLELLGLDRKKETLTHLRFYFHEVVTHPNPTSIRVAMAKTSLATPTAFGLVAVFDDALTAGPDRASKLVGRAQGIYALASQSEPMMLMVNTFVFTDGEFNGSSIGILGRNAILSPVREMPVAGGTGRFRFARGYVQARTHVFEKTGNAVVKYDVYVLH